jgi:hypothetical protein
MVYAIYKTDNAHSYPSRELIGIAQAENPLNLIIEAAKKEGEELSEDDIYNIVNINQTQNYSGKGEFDVEAVETDKLIFN